MLKQTHYHKKSNSSHFDKYSTAIININNKPKIKNQQFNSNMTLTPQQKNYMRQNGSLLFDFIKDKYQILQYVNLCNGQTIIDFCKAQSFKDKLNQISQSVEFIQNEILIKFNAKLSTKITAKQLNQLIYSSLIQLSQVKQNLKHNFILLNKNKPITKRLNTQQINTSRYVSPQFQQFSKRSIVQNSTNHLSRAQSQKEYKISSFDNFINTQQLYVLTSRNLVSPQQIPNFTDEDSLDEKNQNFQTNYQYEQKLKNYFYEFIISLSASEPQHHAFLNNLFNELAFDQKFSSEQVQKTIINDHQYCLRILMITLKNKFANIIQTNISSKEQISMVYLPNQINFLTLTFKFIIINIQQLTDKIDELCKRMHQIQQIFYKINLYTNKQYQIQNNSNLSNTLTRYLPQQDQSTQNQLPSYTFSYSTLQNLKNKILQTQSIKENRHALSASLNVFQKNVLQICFDRIKLCKRFNLQALEFIAEIINNSKVLKNVLYTGLNKLCEYSEQVKEIQEKGDKVAQIYNQKFVKKIFSQWKKIKQRKLKLLKILMKKKIKLQKKQQYLTFNRWRINISRIRIQQKMLIHSSSCAAVMNKFTDYGINHFEQKKQKINQSIEKYIHIMSQITVKRSNSFKNLSKSRTMNNSRSKIVCLNSQKTNQDLKLLNYQYKNNILERLNKNTQKELVRRRQLTGKILSNNNKNTLLKI